MVNVDLINNGQAQGDVAGQLMSGGLSLAHLRPFLAVNKSGVWGAYISVYKGKQYDPTKNESYEVKPIQVNATLRRDEWIALDEAVLGVARERLVGIADLENAGLTYTLGNALGTTVLEYHDIDDSLTAEISMDGASRAQNGRPNFGSVYLPIPIIHADYQLNLRALAASRSMSNPLDTTLAENASRKVAEKLEDMLFKDLSLTFGGGTIYSYVNHPDRIPQNLTLAWDNASKTAQQIYDDVLAMKQKMLNKALFGKYKLYIPTKYETILDKVFVTSVDGTQTNGTNNTIREQLLKIDGLTGISVVDKLADDNVLMVRMESSTVRLVKGMAIQNVEWMSHGNFVKNYKVMTIQVPQIRSDQSGNCGIVHCAAGIES